MFTKSLRQILWLVLVGTSILFLAGPVISNAMSNSGMLALLNNNIIVTRDLPSIEIEKTIRLLETAATWDRHQATLLPKRQGLVLLFNNQPHLALDFFLVASKRQEDVLASYWLGKTYEQLGDSTRAIQIWLSVDFKRIALQRADSLLVSSKLDQANAIYTDVLTHDPRSIHALLGQSRVAKQRKDWEQSAKILDQVLTVAPKNSEALVERGIVYYYGERQIDTAIDKFDHAIQFNPQCLWCYLVYADIVRDAGRFETAIQILDRARNKNFQPDNLIYQKLAQIFLENLADPVQARDVCRQGLTLYDKDADLYFLLGRAERNLGNSLLAQNAFQRAVELAPDRVEFQKALR